MTRFRERFEADYNAQRDYNIYQESLGYYRDNDRILWELLSTVDVEIEKRFEPGACAVVELESYWHRAAADFGKQRRDQLIQAVFEYLGEVVVMFTSGRQLTKRPRAGDDLESDYGSRG